MKDIYNTGMYTIATAAIVGLTWLILRAMGEAFQ